MHEEGFAEEIICRLREAAQQEESRIQDVYERRRSEKSRLYLCFNRGQLFWFQELKWARFG